MYDCATFGLAGHQSFQGLAQSAAARSPPWAVPQARHVSRATLFEKNRTDPSHSVVMTPLGCRLRAAMDSPVSGLESTRFKQGGFDRTAGVQFCAVLSGNP